MIYDVNSEFMSASRKGKDEVELHGNVTGLQLFTRKYHFCSFKRLNVTSVDLGGPLM